MRRLFTIAVILLAAGAATWFAYPASRQWPVLSHVGGLLGLSKEAGKDAAGAKERAGATKGARGQAVPVMVATAVNAEMPIILSAPGTVEALATVEVKPRVDGQISEVAFKEGDEVKAGAVLFRLDDRLVKAQMKQAEANIARDTASLKDAEAILKRRETLVTKNIVTEEATDTQRSNVEVLKAAISAGHAQVEGWRTQLDYLTVLAPITGRTGSVKTKIGANVRSADATSLVVINQTKPIAVAFSVPQGDLINLRRALATRSEATIRVGGAAIEARGKVVFIDNQVNTSTGTLMGKVEVSNEDEALWPGQAVDVELVVERKPGYVAVPSSAVLPSQQGMIAWVIGADGRVAPRPVTLARMIGNRAYVFDGLAAGDRVVTDGQLRLAPGGAITIREPGEQPRGNKAPQGEAAAPDKRGTAPAAREMPASGPASMPTSAPTPASVPERGRT